MPSPAPIGNTYDKYGTRNPIERRLMQGFFDALDTALPTTRPRRALEVGVGEGEVARRVMQRWPEVAYTGIDLPDEQLAASWRSIPLAGSFADITELPFSHDSFELVLAIEVLEHVADPAAALVELARVCGGTIVLSVPREPVWRAANLARGKYARDLGNTPGHVNHWSKRQFTALVDSHLVLELVLSPFPWTMVVARRR